MSNLPSSYDPHENSYASYSLIVENFGNVKIGGSCNSNNDCFDKNCIKGTCMPVCNKELKLSTGCDCTQHTDCKSNNCVDNKCSSTDCNGEKKAATCSCQSNIDCLNNDCLNTKKCSTLLPLGSRCFKHRDCASKKCKSTKCTN